MLSNQHVVVPGACQAFNAEEVERLCRERLAERINSEADYSVEEILKVGKLYRRLVPSHLRLDFDTHENLRALAKLAQVELKPARLIKSHRRFLGPVVVFVKKLTWPLVKFHFQQTMSEISDFAAQSAETQARCIINIVELQQGKTELTRPQSLEAEV